MADVLLRDLSGRVLLVNPTYKPGWDLPGGMAEANEPPEDTVRRELMEELGLHVTLLRLLVVDWIVPHGPWDDQIAFIFDGGTLDQADRVQPRDGELSEAAFVTAADAAGRVQDRIRRRFEHALKALDAGRPLYLRDGAPVMWPERPTARTAWAWASVAPVYGSAAEDGEVQDTSDCQVSQ